VADDADRAQETIERSLEASLEEVRLQLPAGESLEFCESCMRTIPLKRRIAIPGCRKCVRCQETAEILSHWRN
jgi:phage/conjugal plasmid C-4 type zinc finger TraR family protein